MTDDDSLHDPRPDTDRPPNAGSCNPTLEQLYDYMGGNLGDLSRNRFQTHRQLCPGCDDAFQFHQGLVSMLGSSCREEMPPAFRQRLLDSLNRLL